MNFAQEISSKLINENLDNFVIRESSEDVGKVRGKVLNVKTFLSTEQSKKIKTNKIFENQFMALQSSTDFRKDGRINSSTKYSDDYTTKTNFFYDKKSGNVVLRLIDENSQYRKSQLYNWLFYNDENILMEDIQIRKQKEKLNYESYQVYTTKDSLDYKIISVNDISYDSIKYPLESYIFSKNKLTKKLPSFQSKVQKLELVNGVYKVIEINNYVVDGRNVFFKYDKKGNVLSEIWYNEKGLANKKTSTFNEDYSEEIVADFDLLGTHEFSKTYKKFDDFGNLLSSELKYYNNSQSSAHYYVYDYDKEGNWIVKRKFTSEILKGIPGKRKLVNIELREISYYDSSTIEENFTLPKQPEILDKIRKNIPAIAEKNDKYIKLKTTALENNDYDAEILTKKAKEIKDFTPKFWILKETAYGNLDDDEADEAVAVYEMPSVNNEDSDQVLAIFKKENDFWVLNKQTSAPILSTQSGGMMGNPFAGVSISRKTILVTNFGGSRQKWEYKNRYRFQNNDWYLIGSTLTFGAPCDYYVNFDYNLSTGDAVYKKTTDQCDRDSSKTSEKSYKTNKKISLPTMDNFIPGSTVFKFPNLRDEVYY